MTTAEFGISEIKETEYTYAEYSEGGVKVVIPKESESNWITKFLIANPHRDLNYIFNLAKFKLEDNLADRNYHLLTVILENGQKHKMLFLNKKCIADEWTCMRGGARENAGRKQKDESGKAVTVSFCCSPEQKEQLQKNVAESGMKQSEYILKKLFS